MSSLSVIQEVEGCFRDMEVADRPRKKGRSSSVIVVKVDTERPAQPLTDDDAAILRRMNSIVIQKFGGKCSCSFLLFMCIRGL